MASVLERVFDDALVLDHRLGRRIEALEMRARDMRVERRLVAIDLIQEDLIRLAGGSQHIEALAARFGVARSARIVEHERHEARHAALDDVELDRDGEPAHAARLPEDRWYDGPLGAALAPIAPLGIVAPRAG